LTNADIILNQQKNSHDFVAVVNVANYKGVRVRVRGKKRFSPLNGFKAHDFSRKESGWRAQLSTLIIPIHGYESGFPD